MPVETIGEVGTPGCRSRVDFCPGSPSGTLSRSVGHRRQRWSWKSTGRSMNSAVIPSRSREKSDDKSIVHGT